jgi:hypothetical protein
MSESDDEFELCVDIGDCYVDFLDGNLDAGVDGYEACDVGVEVYFCLEVINIKSRDDLVVCSTCLGSVCMDLLYPSD